ncbi:uncharacterized oxidoreductase TM_0325-like isoform X3 [Haliotis rubra]|uniref:uncharacterized oxidoreductase TM_0325-like isoform X3 n=1 Tax=Haliotis rubra TaxID=36100 RepID=UPI001EE5B4E8|nr:uncharacterized oxidoreductase TM_0325-like isoform X3 [Haliotis rubra]
MANFAGRVVLITGASAGLGEGTALHFAKQGAKLALTGREKTRLDDVAKRCSECGIPADNVNNAGLVFPGESMGMSEPQYDQTMDLNMKVPFLMSQLAVPHLEKTQGNIVNISSLFGARAMAMTGIYCVSKAALDMFTQCLALELAPKKVRVNSVNPGTVATPIFGREGSVLHGKDDEIKKFLEEQANATPLGRLGTPQDVAGAIGYLASDAASYVTGQILLVDGGRSCTFK